MNIIKKLIKYNFTPKPNRKFEYLIIHDTGNKNIGANADMHYSYFNSGDKDASADFFISNDKIIQLIDIENSYSWAIGDGNGIFGITNSNSISLEICVNSDGDYNKTVDTTVDLTVYLMKKYNIGLDKVVRHYDCSRKQCPKSMYDNGKWTKWNEFKNKVANKLIEEVFTMFKDESQISDYAKESVKKLYDNGIIKGDNECNFKPLNSITRQDLACVIANLMRLLGK